MKTSFNQSRYIKRQKLMIKSLSSRPDIDYSLLGKVIICYNDKPEWVMLCNANGWDS